MGPNMERRAAPDGKIRLKGYNAIADSQVSEEKISLLRETYFPNFSQI